MRGDPNARKNAQAGRIQQNEIENTISLFGANHHLGDAGWLVGPARYSSGTLGTRGELAVWTMARCCARRWSRCRSFSRLAAPPVSRRMPLRIMDSREWGLSVALRTMGGICGYGRLVAVRSSISECVSSISSSDMKAESFSPTGGVPCGAKVCVWTNRLLAGEVTDRVWEAGRNV